MPRPNKQMQANAKRALMLREKAGNKGMTAVGLRRANQFAKGENVSLATVKRTFSFLSRARTYYKPGKNTPGTRAFLAWGGEAGLGWARRILGK